jgi:hypothetical protein
LDVKQECGDFRFGSTYGLIGCTPALRGAHHLVSVDQAVGLDERGVHGGGRSKNVGARRFTKIA